MNPVEGVEPPPEPAISPPRATLVELDMLRGFAVLLVMIHHIVTDLLVWPGFPSSPVFHHFGLSWGVDLFFAVSGFVIARTLVPRLERAQGRQVLDVTFGFWMRRAYRLWPSAWACLAAILVLTVTFNRSGVFDDLATNVSATVAGVLQVANFRFAESFARWRYGTSFVFWSLSLEEQFYIALPVVIVLAGRGLAPLMAAVVAVQFYPVRWLYARAFRTDALAWGVLIALAERGGGLARAEPTVLARRSLGFVVALALIAVACVSNADRFVLTAGAGGMVSAACAALVALAAYDRGYLGVSGKLRRALAWTGERSYALYLYQIPVFYTAREACFRFFPAASGAFRSILLLLSALPVLFVVADLSLKYLERPLRERGRRVSARWWDASSSAG